MLLVGGGQEYYGPTSIRDKQVVQLIAKKLFIRLGNTIEIVTGGMPGIPMDFIKSWMTEGGTRVRFLVSDEHLAAYPERELGVEYESGGKTQAERRQALTKLPGLTAAFFVQGGQYTTDEIIKCQQRGLPTICFVGSGGASGGVIPYKEALPKIEAPEWMKNNDPAADTDELAALLTETLVYCFH